MTALTNRVERSDEDDGDGNANDKPRLDSFRLKFFMEPVSLSACEMRAL